MRIKEEAEKLWIEHEAYIKKFCEYKLSSKPDYIDDCIQEVFLALINALKSEKQIEHPKAWLTKVASNKIKDIYENEKKKNLNTVPFEDEYVKQSTDFDYSFTEEISSEQVERNFKKIINSLTEKEKQLIEDFYIKKTKQKDLANQMNISENTLRQQVFRLKRKIIKELKNFSD